MTTGKINKRSVEALPVGLKDAFLWDDDLRGFGIKVTPSGKKSYLVQYRMGGRGSATKRYTIGPHGVWDPAKARTEAEKVLRLASTGVDPQAAAREHERVQQTTTFEAMADRFLAEYGKRHWRPGTYASAESNMRRWVSPVLRGVPVSTIDRKNLNEVFDKLPPNSPALPRSIFALVGKMFSWLVERGELERSPLETMRSPPAVKARDRVLSDEELRQLALASLDLGAPFDALVRLLIITGQRRDEVAGMSWRELDQRRREWTLPSERTKNGQAHTVPLNAIAISELDDLCDGERWPRTGLVLTTNGTTPVSGFSRAKARLDRLIAQHATHDMPPWRLHDLRRSFATNMQRLDVRFEVTEALLNHVSGSRGGVAGVYQRHDWAGEKREAMDKWSDKLKSLISSIDEVSSDEG